MAKDQTLGASNTLSAVVSFEPGASEKLTGVPARRSARPAEGHQNISVAGVCSTPLQYAQPTHVPRMTGSHATRQPVQSGVLPTLRQNTRSCAPVWTHSTATMIVHVAVMSTAAALRWRSWCIVGICERASCMVPYASSHHATGTLPPG